MAPEKLTEYERRRLENIKRNEEMLAALKIQSKVSQLSAPSKRPRPQQKSYKLSPEKKQRTQTPVVLRRSLRTRGVPPDASTAGGLKEDFDESLRSVSKRNPESGTESELKRRAYEKGPIRLSDAYRSEGTGKNLIETILKCSRNTEFRDKEEINSNFINEKEENMEFASSKVGGKICSSIDIEGLALEPENIARVVQGRIFTVSFFPTSNVRLVAVGNKFGDLGFWNVDAKQDNDNDDNGIYLYHPHSAPISGIVFDSFTLTKMFTSSYDGFIRLMNVERELFDLVYSCSEPIFSLSKKPDDMNSLYFGEGSGDIRIWDLRSGKSSYSWDLHQSRINTIDFNPLNTNIMATSSTDGSVGIWDLRRSSACRPKSLKEFNHEKAVHSAYFSPSGRYLATTSVDDRIGLLHGTNYEDLSLIYHYNQTGRWLSSFKSAWGWDDSHLFVGNMKRGVDVISTAAKKVVATLHSEHMTAIPCRFDAHPCEAGMLAGATSGGQVYLWKPSK